MYNHVFLVGRIAQMPDYEIINNYRKDALIHLQEIGRASCRERV